MNRFIHCVRKVRLFLYIQLRTIRTTTRKINKFADEHKHLVVMHLIALLVDEFVFYVILKSIFFSKNILIVVNFRQL